MASVKIVGLVIFTLVGLLLGFNNALPVPDSAGMVELPPGLAYGGIPYGSVSGMLAASQQSQPGTAYYAYNNNLQVDSSAGNSVVALANAPVVY